MITQVQTERDRIATAELAANVDGAKAEALRLLSVANKVLAERRASDFACQKISIAAGRISAGLSLLSEAEKNNFVVRLDFVMPSTDVSTPSCAWDEREVTFARALQNVGDSFYAAVKTATMAASVAHSRATDQPKVYAR